MKMIKIILKNNMNNKNYNTYSNSICNNLKKIKIKMERKRKRKIRNRKMLTFIRFFLNISDLLNFKFN